MGRGALRYPSPEAMPDGMRRLLQRQSEVRVDRALDPKPGTSIVVTEKRPCEAATMAGEVRLPQRHAKHRAGEMNKTEARYAQHLDALHAAGEVRWWAFERIKLRLAPNTHFTVDFFVQRADGAFECHEVKGRKGKGYWAEEDAKLKVKVAAELFPVFAFRIVWPGECGGWREVLVP